MVPDGSYVRERIKYVKVVQQCHMQWIEAPADSYEGLSYFSLTRGVQIYSNEPLFRSASP